jgi:hypothetical protein
VGPLAGLDMCGKSCITGIRSPNLPVRSESLYRLSYPGSPEYVVFTAFLLQQRLHEGISMLRRTYSAAVYFLLFLKYLGRSKISLQSSATCCRRGIFLEKTEYLHVQVTFLELFSSTERYSVIVDRSLDLSAISPIMLKMKLNNP